MSGAIVFKCGTEGGQTYALKAYPIDTQGRRLTEVHRVWRAAIENGCRWLPLIDDSFFASGRFWEATGWLLGSPVQTCDDKSGDPASICQSIRSGASVIADFHRSVQHLAAQSMPAPSVAARIERLDTLREILPMLLTRTVGCDSPALASAIGQTRQLLAVQWPAMAAKIRSTLCQLADVPVPCQYVLRDCHREHLLFDGGKPSGLIDLDAVRIDTPMTDLARWAGDFLVGDPAENEARWQAGLAGLTEKNVLNESMTRPTTDECLRLAKTIHLATTWISLANWIVWIEHERRHFPAAQEQITERIMRLLRCARATLWE